MNNIILIGFMGAGKTTIGQLLAKETDRVHIDFDELITEKIGCTIQEYFRTHGEAAFREQEYELLRDFAGKNHVISTGGGIILRPENRKLLQKMSPVIYLRADPEVFIPRLQGDRENVRPLVLSKTPEEIKSVYQPRIPLYEESATFSIDTASLAPEEIVVQILEQLGER